MGVTGGGDARRAGVLCMGFTASLASGASGGGDDAGLETHASTTSLSLCASGDEGGGVVPLDFSSKSASPSVPEPLTLCAGDVHGVERDAVSNRDAQEEEVVVVELVDEICTIHLVFRHGQRHPWRRRRRRRSEERMECLLRRSSWMSCVH